jgi:serine/threonine protein kinase
MIYLYMYMCMCACVCVWSRQLHRLDESTYTGGLVTRWYLRRWYRSPEIMLGDKNYGPSVDMWSIGCILVEMISLCPAFACDTEIECLMVIFKRFGIPDELTYPGIAALPNYTVHFPQWLKPDSLFDAFAFQARTTGIARSWIWCAASCHSTLASAPLLKTASTHIPTSSMIFSELNSASL